MVRTLLQKYLNTVCILLAALLSCLPVAALTQSYSTNKDIDPFITVNRSIYDFDEALDAVVIKPVAKSYDFIMPEFAKRCVSNFFNNLDDINVVVNDVLQLKIDNAMHDSGRFALNTTIGIGGLIDVASGMGLYKNYEDFGQTLGYWGMDSGAYLVLPFLGTSTVRDTVGMFPDYLLNPVFWISDSETRFTLYTLDNIDTRLNYMAAEAMINGDDYVFVRDAYLQRREYLVADGEVYDEWDNF